VQIGDVVTYVDHVGQINNALVNAVWGPKDEPENATDNPSINLVYISMDKSKGDPYGRQIERDTSVVHKANQAAHGNYWVKK